jgi:hypothetical protein
VNNHRRGDVALLSVTHPVLGTEVEIGAHSIRIGPEQYLALVDELCQIAFLAPHLAARIQSLARDIGVREISQYVVWMAEADAAATARILTPRSLETSPRNFSTPSRRPADRTAGPPGKKEEGESKNESDDTVVNHGRAANAGGGNESRRGYPRSTPRDDRGIP